MRKFVDANSPTDIGFSHSFLYQTTEETPISDIEDLGEGLVGLCDYYLNDKALGFKESLQVNYSPWPCMALQKQRQRLRGTYYDLS
jgi:hypothetical protein